MRPSSSYLLVVSFLALFTVAPATDPATESKKPVMCPSSAPQCGPGYYQPEEYNATPNLGYNKLFELQHHFFQRFVYPNNTVEAESINSAIFADNVIGRVSDTRVFKGRELNTEYIFGLFVKQPYASVIGLPLSYEILAFTGNQNIASASTRVQINFPSFPDNRTLPVTVNTWLTFDSNLQITQYDVTFRWFANLMQMLLLSLDPKNPVNATAIAQKTIANAVCTQHNIYCKGKNLQYKSTDDCMEFLTKGVRMGQSFELGDNTLLCRNVHMSMLKYRPDEHCSHIGPTGGGMCIDNYTYESKVNEVVFTNSPWIPDGTSPHHYHGLSSNNPK
ncbi:hypothetical protein GQ43DRAFT_431101 [Delitschia confertaspora ATCC 74209]|uniref:Uncharacterized protein n=1 Tax=Delitschia confertaspora ATCC 74209 TaxID=1513339 RepID=A0A9P4JM52_9PLEO|nr:hypothetical protein GQ43DRAFT_431101 [Delitschia confertaspora ATCC 74209]